MKPFKTNKKLSLSKSTVSHLNEVHMKRLNGGDISYQTCTNITNDTCESCHPETLCLFCPSWMTECPGVCW